MKRVWRFLKWWFAPEDYAAHAINRRPFAQKMETGFQFGFLVLWCMWVAHDLAANQKGQAIVDSIFLVHRAWCAWRWYKYLRDNDDDDEDDGHRMRVPFWRQVMVGA